ncbi:hypothetical protein [Azospirillum endophyticum]
MSLRARTGQNRPEPGGTGGLRAADFPLPRAPPRVVRLCVAIEDC